MLESFPPRKMETLCIEPDELGPPVDEGIGPFYSLPPTIPHDLSWSPIDLGSVQTIPYNQPASRPASPNPSSRAASEASSFGSIDTGVSHPPRSASTMKKKYVRLSYSDFKKNTYKESSKRPSGSSSSLDTAQFVVNSDSNDIAKTPSQAGLYLGHKGAPAWVTKESLDYHRRNSQGTKTTSSESKPAPEGTGTSKQVTSRCQRANPSTGKPCNIVFSSRYDFRRHMATIHKSGKPKVRCTLCKEEKIFSRPDALLRHTKVVHPDEWFAQRRRNRTRSKDT